MPHNEATAVVRFGPFELDLDRGELRRTDGKAVAIQPRPLEALVLLVRQGGRLVSRETLQEHLWEPGTTRDPDRALNHTIRKLREALKDDAKDPSHVQTVPRRGYRFIAPLDEKTTPKLDSREAATVVPDRGPRPADASGPLALAVGLFRDLPGDGSTPTLSEGVAEELLAELVSLRADGLAVVDDPAAHRSAGTNGTLFRLQGSVRRSEANVRVHAHLVRAENGTIGTVIGTTRFDLPMGAVFELQQRIARRIVEALVRPIVPAAEPAPGDD